VQAARPVSGPAPVIPPSTPAAAHAAPATGPEELDLSNAQVGAVDDGDEHGEEAAPAADGGKPASADELASGYDSLLKNL
jgi:hypothetical protein